MSGSNITDLQYTINYEFNNVKNGSSKTN